MFLSTSVLWRLYEIFWHLYTYYNIILTVCIIVSMQGSRWFTFNLSLTLHIIRETISFPLGKAMSSLCVVGKVFSAPVLLILQSRVRSRHNAKIKPEFNVIGGYNKIAVQHCNSLSTIVYNLGYTSIWFDLHVVQHCNSLSTIVYNLGYAYICCFACCTKL